MPNMDGFTLVDSIRKDFGKNELAIIGLSLVDSRQLSAQFIKQGANDFLPKSFYPEELYCRINQNLELLEMIRALEYAAYHDELTGLLNRRAFFDRAHVILEQAKQDQSNVSVALIDLDHFKSVNDNYGHACGDEVLRLTARQLKTQLKHATIARIGGEEFCVLIPATGHHEAMVLLEILRKAQALLVIKYQRHMIQTSFSAGVTTWSAGDPSCIDELLSQADVRLYQAKDAGRNCVVGEELTHSNSALSAPN
jgi:diguanylate cyclase (GGDEF)-like protein